MAKYTKYQDYVIRDGKLVGEFEEMYQDFDDPWQQTTREKYAYEKVVAVEIIRLQGYKRVIEIGCGLGDFMARIASVASVTLGIDISETAIIKARQRHPDLEFMVGDVLDYHIHRQFKPDAIVLAETTWYILDKLDSFKSFLHRDMRGVGLIHLLMTYRGDEQKYGREFFTELDSIMNYWDCVSFEEWGSFSSKEYNGGKRTFFHGIIN
ncbi:MAG: class I SAM-dependent methyltransferase [Deltaproteobacteria bacterium]|nr:class I SAM-dependent methyltransferase [Deltaproteobacteria bacterium]